MLIKPIQFIINNLNNFLQVAVNIFNITIIFLTQHTVIIYSLLFGLLSFLILTIIIQTQIIPSFYKKLFLENYPKSKTNSNPPSLTRPFWQKIPSLNNFYKTYQWADLPFTYEFFLTIGLSLFIIIFIFGLATLPLFLTITLAILITYLYFFIIKVIAKKNHDRISKHLPFVLDTLSGSIQSGYSLSQALQFTAQELGMPFKLFFQEMLIQLDYNIPLTKVFKNTQEMTTNQEFKMVLDGLIIQNKMGGDIVAMLQQMADWIRQKNKLQRDIQTFTSQGRLSGIIIVLLWPISAIIFYFLNSDYISILFNNDTGQMFLFLSLFLEILGFAMIWKIIKIKI